MTYFALIHDSTGDRAVSYSGMDEPTVTALLNETGVPFDLIDEAAFTAFIQAHQPVPMTAQELIALFRSEASTQAFSGGNALATLLRAAALVIMAELNILRQRDADRSVDVAAAASLADLKTRWAARSTLAQRTANQIQTAIQSKINAGEAD